MVTEIFWTSFDSWRIIPIQCGTLSIQWYLILWICWDSSIFWQSAKKKLPLTETNQCVWLLSLLLKENRSFYPSIQVCDRVEECNLVYNLQFFVMLPNTVVSHIIIHHRCSGHVFFHNSPQFMPVDHHRLPRVETSIWTSTASARIFCRTDFSFYESLHQLSIISNRFLVH